MPTLVGCAPRPLPPPLPPRVRQPRESPHLLRAQLRARLSLPPLRTRPPQKRLQAPAAQALHRHALPLQGGAAAPFAAPLRGCSDLQQRGRAAPRQAAWRRRARPGCAGAAEAAAAAAAEAAAAAAAAPALARGCSAAGCQMKRFAAPRARHCFPLRQALFAEQRRQRWRHARG